MTPIKKNKGVKTEFGYNPQYMHSWITVYIPDELVADKPYPEELVMAHGRDLNIGIVCPSTDIAKLLLKAAYYTEVGEWK